MPLRLDTIEIPLREISIVKNPMPKSGYWEGGCGTYNKEVSDGTFQEKNIAEI